jgi:hypothetical protein
MSMIGIFIMWIWTALVFVLWSRWTMGAKSDQRQAYWDKFEVK